MNLITSFNADITVFDFKSLISIDDTIDMVIKNAQGTDITNLNDDLIGTGTTITLIQNNTISSFTIVILGDVNCNGKRSLADLVIIRDNLLEINLLTSFKQIAGDIYLEGTITLNSLVGIMAIVSETTTII